MAIPAPTAGAPPAARLAALALAAMASLPFLVPLHRLPIPSFDAEWLAVALGLLAMLFLCTRRATISFPPFAAGLLVLAGVILLQAMLGMLAWRANALMPMALLAWAAALAMAARTLGTGVLAPMLAWGLLAGGVANGALALLQFLKVAAPAWLLVAAPYNQADGLFGNLAQQNHYAAQIAMALASLGFLQHGGRIKLLPALLCAALLLFCLHLSGSRSVLIYIAWLVLCGWMMVQRVRVHWKFLLAGAVALLLMVLAARAGLLGWRAGRIVSFSSAFGSRVFLWQSAWAMWQANPLLGVGFDGFGTALADLLRPGHMVWTIDQFAHNLPLQLLATTGLAGALAIGLPLASFAWGALRHVMSAPRLYCWSLLGIMGIHSMVEQPLYYAYFLGLAALAAGMLDPGAWTYAPGSRSRLTCAALLLLALGGMSRIANDYDALARGFYDPLRGSSKDAALARSLHRDPFMRAYSELALPQAFLGPRATANERLVQNERLSHFAPLAALEYQRVLLLAEVGDMQAASAQLLRAATAYPESLNDFAPQLEQAASTDQERYAPLLAQLARLR